MTEKWSIQAQVATLAFVSALLVYLMTGFDILHSGDAAKYTTYVNEALFWGIPTHVGYITVSIMVHGIFGVFGYEALDSAVLTSSLWGACGVAFTLLFCRAQGVGVAASAIAAFSLALAPTYVFFSSVVQYSSMQVACFAGSLWLISIRKPRLSGAMFALSTLATPPAVFCYPAMLALCRNHRSRIVFSLFAGVPVLLLSLVDYERYYFGSRGILGETNDFAVPLEHTSTVLTLALFQIFRDFGPAIIAMVAGIIICYRTRKRLFLFCALLLGAHLIYYWRFMYYPGFWLPIYPMLALLVGLALHTVARTRWYTRPSRRIVVLLVVGIQLLFMAFGTARFLDSTYNSARSQLDDIFALNDLMSPEDSLVSWHATALLWGFYVKGHAYHPQSIRPGHLVGQMEKANRDGDLYIHKRLIPWAEGLLIQRGIEREVKVTSRGDPTLFIPRGTLSLPDDPERLPLP